MPAETTTVAEVLKAAGYHTACVVKWGMGMFESTGSPLKKGFDHFFGYNCQRHAHSSFPTYLYRNEERVPLPENEGRNKTTYAQNLIAEDALRWVRAQAEQNAPFFLYYAITLPHGPTKSTISGCIGTPPGARRRRHTQPWSLAWIRTWAASWNS